MDENSLPFTHNCIKVHGPSKVSHPTPEAPHPQSSPAWRTALVVETLKPAPSSTPAWLSNSLWLLGDLMKNHVSSHVAKLCLSQCQPRVNNQEKWLKLPLIQTCLHSQKIFDRPQHRSSWEKKKASKSAYPSDRFLRSGDVWSLTAATQSMDKVHKDKVLP